MIGSPPAPARPEAPRRDDPPRGNDYSALAPPRLADPAPTVSVVIPYGGRARHLEAVLAALAEQAYPTTRLQAVVVRCPAAEDPPPALRVPAGGLDLRWTRLDKTGFAPASARNVGIAAGEGEIIVSIDDDVVAPPWLVASHARWHLADSPVATFGLRRFIRLPEGRVAGPGIHARLAREPAIARSRSNRPGHGSDWRLAHARVIRRHPHPHHCFHGCNVSYRREQALEVGGWNAAFDGAYGYEDVEMGARLHAAGAYLVWVPRATVLHLEEEGPRPGPGRAARQRNLELVCRAVPGYRLFREAEERIAAAPPRI